MKARSLATLATVAALLMGAVVTTSPANASAAADNCNYNAAGMKYFYYSTSGPVVQWPTKYCYGEYNVNSDGHRIEPGDWSGWVDFRDGSWTYFCDRKTTWLGGKRVIKIEMSPTKIPLCGGSLAPDEASLGQSNSGRSLSDLVRE
ncbi:hypothetical protein O7634_27620 [Micromonospora sp. WMMD1120]|uniref:hypothetical protein n=1 Tax=Micromonospora sp. WMMD1120 TaxID=3016106 RepID=UPI002416F9A7|nr:hypothetical protein [Micromonospora sp. WMMD1120]MDG4810541.1 hypothetical protein [Micromonospora sp. WMMD1120]